MPIPILQYGVKVRDPTTQQFSDLAALRGGQGPTGPGVPAGGTDGDVLVKNGATDYDATWKKTPPQMGSLATIEPTSSASKAYAAGDYLVYNGQLYKVTKTISPDETLTPGGNIAEYQVAVTHSGSATLNASICTGGLVNLSLRNGVLVIDGYVTLADSSPGINAVLFSVPEAFRPPADKLFRAFATYGGNTGFYGISLTTGGQCKTSTGGSTYTGQMFFPSVTLIV